MQQPGFREAVEMIVAREPRIHPDAYFFLRDALDHAVKQKRRSGADEPCHVSGQELMEAVRVCALRQFGPMVLTVFEHWGIRGGEDFGQMVFWLVDCGVFGKRESDSLSDFTGVYDFGAAFVEPFLPAGGGGRRGARRAVSRKLE